MTLGQLHATYYPGIMHYRMEMRPVAYQDLTGISRFRSHLHMFHLRPHTQLYRVPVVKRQ